MSFLKKEMHLFECFVRYKYVEKKTDHSQVPYPSTMRFLVFSVLVWLIMKADTTNGKRHREIAALFGILCTSILFSILSVPSIRDDLETIHRLASLDCSSPPTECVFAFAETDWTDRGARRRLSTGTSCSTTNWTPIYVVQSS